MKVESLLKPISEGTTVNVNDRYGTLIICFKFGDDIAVFSVSFLFHNIKKIEIKKQFDLNIYLDETKND